MKFDPYAFLAAAGNEAPDGATYATYATPRPEMSPRVAQVARVARAEPSKSENSRLVELPCIPEPSQPGDEDAPHGRNCVGNPKTWTGRVVSLEEWRRLSEWDKHGSTNKLFNGFTSQWEPKKGGRHDLE